MATDLRSKWASVLEPESSVRGLVVFVGTLVLGIWLLVWLAPDYARTQEWLILVPLAYAGWVGQCAYHEVNPYRRVLKRTMQGGAAVAALAVAAMLWPSLDRMLNSAADSVLPTDPRGVGRLLAGGLILVLWAQYEISKSVDRLHAGLHDLERRMRGKTPLDLDE